MALFYGAYELSRAAVPTHSSLAEAHARALIRLERHLHLNIERSVNEVLAHHAWLGVTSGYYYATLNFVVTPAVLIWLYRRRPHLYGPARTTLVIASFGALIVYVLYPVAPPRLTILGTTDILVAHNIFGAAHAAKSGGFVNIYAAMPSLHVGWAVWVALAVWRGNHGSRWRHVVWLYPTLTTLVVLGTANHYLLDAVAGALTIGAASFAVKSAHRISARIPGTRTSRQARHQSKPVWSPPAADTAMTRCAVSSPPESIQARAPQPVSSTLGPIDAPPTSRLVCELCDFAGPRRYLITFAAMLEANGLHLDPTHPALAGDDLDTTVEATLPVETNLGTDSHALDTVLADFAGWGGELAHITAHGVDAETGGPAQQ